MSENINIVDTDDVNIHTWSVLSIRMYQMFTLNVFCMYDLCYTISIKPQQHTVLQLYNIVHLELAINKTNLHV